MFEDSDFAFSQRSCKDPLVETNPQPSNRIPSGDKPAPRSTGQFVDKTTAFRFGEHRRLETPILGRKKKRVCFFYEKQRLEVGRMIFLCCGTTENTTESRSLHPGRLTWNTIMEVWKIVFLSKWVICRFHVNLPGCKYSGELFQWSGGMAGRPPTPPKKHIIFFG